MHSRKKFLQSQGALFAGTALLKGKNFSSWFSESMNKPVGLQLFTLFNTFEDDVAGDLKKIAAIGYLEIESAFSKKGGFYAMKAKEFAAMVKDMGMSWKSHHVIGAPVDGKISYHLLLSDTNPDTMKIELDLCWATKAGVDPVELFKKHPGRFHLWHVKDLDKEMTGPQPVGTGIIDFKRIFKYASTAGMKHFFVEHDMPKDAYASITQSFNYIKNNL